MSTRVLATALALGCTGVSALHFSDVNIVAVTDVHSWIAGGDRQVPPGSPNMDANFGDLVSFVERARTAAAKKGKDVFLVDNGDVVDGTGLSNVADDHCSDLLPLLQQVPFDALNCGNHELYSNSTMETFASSGYIKSWEGRYLTSNVINATTLKPLGARSTMLVGPVSGVRILTFGFMYDMSVNEGRCTGVDITPVYNATSARWFHDALGNGSKYDAILLLAHMDAYNYLIKDIVKAIRARLPDMPIQVIAGHSHERKQLVLDGRAAVFEPGNYFNTVGYASFALPTSSSHESNISFSFTDINASVTSMADALGKTELGPGGVFPTANGTGVANAIAAEEEALGLTDVLGCAKQDYLEGPDLYNLYVGEIVPAGLFTPPSNKSQWFVQSTGSLRYDIYKGNVTTDDIYKVLPFKDKLYTVRDLHGSDLVSLLALLNDAQPVHESPWNLHNAKEGACHGWCDRAGYGSYISTNNKPATSAMFDAFFVEFDVPTIQGILTNVTHKTVKVEAVTTGPATDTDMMLHWANTSLPKKC